MQEKNYKLKGQLKFQNKETINFKLLKDQDVFEKDDVFVKVTEENHNDCQFGFIEIKLKNSYFKKNFYLEMEKPIQLWLPVDEIPEKITALYLFLDWWTRPSFIDDFSQIPERTQIALFKFKDHYGCFIPMVGKAFKATLNGGTKTEIGIEMTAYLGGLKEVKEPFYLYAKAPTLDEAIHKAFSALADYKELPLREKRRFPDLLRYLGWCSWDAVYKEVDEEAIRKKVEELKNKNVPIRWLIIDDGWMDTEGEFLNSFEPDKNKFPNGFKNMLKDIKSDGIIDAVGVWHALGGYWSGINPESPLVTKEDNYLYKAVNGKVIPSPFNGGHFYRDWYKYLRNEGIDFVKVDAQSSIPSFFENSLSVSEGSRGLNEALEEGAIYFDNTIINCMGMAMENVLARPNSSVSRNSNDFFPNDKNSFSEHLIENAYNALYHNEFYNCDWDMFWTTHPQNLKHSLLRAISGGPVYVSDKIGETNPEVLKPLAYLDGEILLMDRSAKPTEDSAFIDPLKEGVLKLHNVASWGNKKAGGIALFNLTSNEQSYSFKPSDIVGITYSDSYWVYDYFNKKAFILKRDESTTGFLETEAYAWFIVLPKLSLSSPLGLLDKFVGFSSVESIIENNDIQTVVIKETGTTGWLSDLEPKEILLNSVNVTDKVKRSENLYILQLTEKASKMILTIKY